MDQVVLRWKELFLGPPKKATTYLLIHKNPALNDSYHLTGTSPAKNNGICGEINWGGGYERYALYDDIDGDARPGWNEELGCNIGADEYRFPWILFNSVTTKKQ